MERWIADLPRDCWCGYTDGGHTPAQEATATTMAKEEKCGYGGTLRYRRVEAHSVDDRRVGIRGKKSKAELYMTRGPVEMDKEVSV